MDSESWTGTTTVEIGTGETFLLQTPGMPASADKANAEAAIDDMEVIVPEQVDLVFAPDSTSVEVVNLMDAWPVGTRVYVYVPAREMTGEAIGEVTGDVEANAEAIAALDTRVSDHDGALADLEARVAALEAASPPAG